MHFAEDPHLAWMIFWGAVLALGALISFLYLRRSGRREQGGDARSSKDDNLHHDRTG